MTAMMNATGALSHWWKEEDPSAAMFGQFRALESDQQSRLMDYRVFEALYGNEELTSFGGTSIRSDRISMNITQSMVDTVCSKMLAQKPKPTFLTSGADWQLQQRAEKMDMAVNGIYYHNNFYRLAMLTFRDACIDGTGYLKVHGADRRVCFERVLPEEVFVDQADALYGTPSVIYQRRYVSRSRLLDDPDLQDKREIIEKAGAADPYHLGRRRAVEADVVEICESWLRPSGEGKKDGRHAMCVDSGTLCDEASDGFPFAVMYWSPRNRGFYGQGLVEQLVGLQIELNKLLRRVQLSMHLMSIPYYLLEHGSRIVKSHLNNEVGHFVEYSGIKPEARVNQSVHPEVFAHIDRIYRVAYEVAGISQLSANAKKPAGLESEPSLRTFHDIESERFMTVGQFFEDFVIDVAKLTVRTAKTIPNLEVKGVNREAMESVRWPDCDLDDSDYVLKIYPTNLLPTQPAAKTQRAIELVQGGVLSPLEAQRLLDFPDIEAALSRKLATHKLVEKTMHKILVEGEIVTPEPFQDLQVSLEIAQQRYLDARMRNAPPANLAKARLYMQACDEMITAAMQPPPPTLTMNAPGASPVAPGMPAAMPQQAGAAPAPQEAPPMAA